MLLFVFLDVDPGSSESEWFEAQWPPQARNSGRRCKVVKNSRLGRIRRLYMNSWKVPPVLQPTIAAIVRGDAIQAWQKTFQAGQGSEGGQGGQGA